MHGGEAACRGWAQGAGAGGLAAAAGEERIVFSRVERVEL